LKRRGNLRFGSDEEILVYDALLRRQKALPQEGTIGILPGCALCTLRKTFWPDFLITHRGKAGVIEVDGPHHRGRAANDHSRDGYLRDAGIRLVERVVVEDTIDAATLDQFVERFLMSLTAA
jgi:hypothetical protein